MQITGCDGSFALSLKSLEKSPHGTAFQLGVIHKPCGQSRGRGVSEKPCLSTWREGLKACPRGQKCFMATHFAHMNFGVTV